jgi:hypothetical protein
VLKNAKRMYWTDHPSNLLSRSVNALVDRRGLWG